MSELNPRVGIREVLARHAHLRDDHLRYLEKWGLVRPVVVPGSGRTYGFQDLAVIRQTSAALAEGRPFRAVVRALEAERHGQLTFDFRLDAEPARVVAITPRERPTAALEAAERPGNAEAAREAEALFLKASALDAEDDARFDEIAGLYRRALELDPWLVAALINLGNLHYARARLAEARALYEQAIHMAPDYFEAHYNLANVLHDLGCYPEARDAYIAALAVNPRYADAHFYLAVTLEKMGRSAEARPHWQTYQQLAPDGDWVELAKEFSE